MINKPINKLLNTYKTALPPSKKENTLYSHKGQLQNNATPCNKNVTP